VSYRGHVFTKVHIPGELEVDLDREIVRDAVVDWHAASVHGRVQS
jgi:hypothetical protein